MNKSSFSKLVPPFLGRSFQGRRAKLLWVSAGSAALMTGLMSCGTLDHAIMAPPSVPGATFVGSKACADCHDEIVRDFRTSDHSKLQARGKNAENAGCESCHGPGSLHVNSGGDTKLIVNPRKSPETCFQCHLEIRAKFSLPYRHPVMEGRINCGDCHNPHKGSIMKGGGATNLMGKNDTCFQCHTLQKGPFVFEHEAMREGCVTCHDPHGSVNQKLLVARNQMLCYKCHFQQQAKPAGQTVAGGNGIIYHGNDQHSKDVSQGTCWSAGCHQAIHGSQINQKFLY